MLWKMQYFTLRSMGRTNHKFPMYATRNVDSNAPEINCMYVLCAVAIGYAFLEDLFAGTTLSRSSCC